MSDQYRIHDAEYTSAIRSELATLRAENEVLKNRIERYLMHPNLMRERLEFKERENEALRKQNKAFRELLIRHRDWKTWPDYYVSIPRDELVKTLEQNPEL